MIKQHKNIYIKENLQPEGFYGLLSKVLPEINNELNKIAAAFYSYETDNYPIKSCDNLFTIIERTWVGIFNNALLRCEPEIKALQEFSVLQDDKYYGRCDLLFTFNTGKNDIDILTEAKCYEFRNNWDSTLNKQFYIRILQQAYNYYKAESEYYTKEVWLMCLVFEWIRNKELLEKAKLIMDEWDNSSDIETDFITLFFGEQRGVFVYGKLINAANFKSLYVIPES